VIAVSTNLNF